MTSRISELPPVPLRTDTPENFVTKSNNWVAAQPTFRAEANALADEVSNNKDIAVSSASAAAISENNSKNSENASASSANYKGAWVSLSGPANIPYSVSHQGIVWNLISNIADVSLSEPGISGDWNRITLQDENGNVSISGSMDASSFKSGTNIAVMKDVNGNVSVLGEVSAGSFKSGSNTVVMKDEAGNVEIPGNVSMASKHVMTEVGDIVILPFEPTEQQLIDRRLLEGDGSSLSRTTYADLFAVIGTTYGFVDDTHFNLPDLRDTFLRGWGHGQGLDPSRAFGSWQKGSIFGFDTGTAGIWTIGDSVSESVSDSQNSMGLDSYQTSDYPNARLISVGGTVNTENLPGSGGDVQSSGVMRPNNMAVMFCIRY